MTSSPQELTDQETRPVLIHFDPAFRQKRRIQSCIFCGQTQSTQKFKGKSVCLSCLHRILNLFPC